MKTYPLTFEANLHPTVWGGHRLQPMKRVVPDGAPIGESWEVSDVLTSMSIVRSGELAGLTLDDAIRQWGPALLGQKIYRKYKSHCPLLVKLIDAARDLSIQVHPGDALATSRHGCLGKTEMWYVIDAEPGSSLLTGFAKEISREEYFRRVADGSIVDVLARQYVKPGDVFFIPSGRIHAICGGIMVCEIQQSSDITYRIWDYGRVGLDGRPRELHTELALDAIDFTVYPEYRTHYTPADGAVTLVDCDYFCTSLITCSGVVERLLSRADSCVTLTCIEGSARIITSSGAQAELPVGTSCLVPAIDSDFRIEGKARLLEAWAK